MIVESCLQASMFFITASSRPERCLWPSLSIDWIPYDCILNPIFSLKWVTAPGKTTTRKTNQTLNAYNYNSLLTHIVRHQASTN